MKIVVNSTPLIALSLINKLEILNQLFDEVIIPAAVYQETEKCYNYKCSRKYC
jgi:predicted nucleic acid-binding protein